MRSLVSSLFPATVLALVPLVPVIVFAGACSSSNEGTVAAVPDAAVADAAPSEPDPVDAADAAPLPSLLPDCQQDPGGEPPAFDKKASADPIGADKFTLEMALAGFPEGTGKLTAAIETEKGVIKCTLSEFAAPVTVANFVGLARGTRPYILTKEWQVGKFYDGLIWHRVVPDFVIQGGDPLGVGVGGPGYDLPVENHIDEPLGTLAMAAAKVPSGSQFYVVVGTGPSPEYNVFGTCDTANAIAIAGVERDKQDKPITDVHIKRVEIGRCP